MKKAIVLITTCFFMTMIFAQNGSAQHYVEKGETMYKIAKTYDMNLNDLIDLNPHIDNPNWIKPHDYIIIRSGTEPQKDLVDYARSLQDVTAYNYGGQNFPYETDCSGWAQGVYKKFGVDLPRVSRDQAKVGKHVTFKQLQIGDLMFFSTRPDKVITHTGIYMGNDYWISNLKREKRCGNFIYMGSMGARLFLMGRSS